MRCGDPFSERHHELVQVNCPGAYEVHVEIHPCSPRMPN